MKTIEIPLHADDPLLWRYELFLKTRIPGPALAFIYYNLLWWDVSGEIWDDLRGRLT